MANPAEERIRLKAVKYLRERYPSPRIIHVLALGQGNVRLDLAAIGWKDIALAEIKSERDTLSRLASQMTAATLVAQETFLVINEIHEAAIQASLLANPSYPMRKDLVAFVEKHQKLVVDWTTEEKHTIAHRIYILVEQADSEELRPMIHAVHGKPLNHVPPKLGWSRLSHKRIIDLLWSEELNRILKIIDNRHKLKLTKKAVNKSDCHEIIIEHVSGEELKTFVCEALRNRIFPRTEDCN